MKKYYEIVYEELEDYIGHHEQTMLVKASTKDIATKYVEKNTQTYKIVSVRERKVHETD